MSDVGVNAPILLLGASGACGQALIQRLAGQGVSVIAVSRRAPTSTQSHVIWMEQDLDQAPASIESSVLVSAGPLVHVLQQLDANSRLGRVVALSSASTVFKSQSPDREERQLIQGLIAQEQTLIERCKARSIALTLIKPTMIYGGESNANVMRVGGLADRMRWLPYCGRGRRHPVHADDLARLIKECLVHGAGSAGVWLVGGGEVLDYPAMLSRIAGARGRMPRLIKLPGWLMKLLLAAAHATGRLGDVRSVMLDRQQVDLIVDDTPARERLRWAPRAFRP